MSYRQSTTSPAKRKSESGLVSFFRIIHAKVVQDLRLGLPKELVREYGNDLGDVALLKVRSGKPWSVELSKSDGGIYFGKGWHEFTEHYSIDVGHFLVFRYDGSSQFYVCIFDMTGCEIAYKLESNKAEEHNQEAGAGPSVFPQEDNVSSEEIDTSSDTLEVARSSKPRNPAFQVTMSRSYINYLPIPSKFARKYLGEKADYFLTLTSLDGRTWHVGYRGEPTNYFWRFDKGWSAFREDMNLKEDNVLIFDLISTKDIVLKVHAGANRNFKGLDLKPSFTVTILPSHKNNMTIPCSFTEKYFTKKVESITLKVSDGRTWSVGCFVTDRGYHVLTRGWFRFRTDMNLREGDVYEFELVDGENVLLEVQVYQDVCSQ